MATRPEEIHSFLEEFKVKLNVWGVVFRDDRGKNTQALFDLDITRNDRIALLKKLVKEDYSEGPLKEKLNYGADMWVFGKELKGKEIYIKIAMGVSGTQVICISFHLAEFKMNYPLKK